MKSIVDPTTREGPIYHEKPRLAATRAGRIAKRCSAGAASKFRLPRTRPVPSLSGARQSGEVVHRFEAYGGSLAGKRYNGSAWRLLMATWDLIAEKTLDLSQKQQEEVLRFVESLRREGGSKGPRKSLRGIWKGFDISSEDIDQARREMWGSFPRTDL